MGSARPLMVGVVALLAGIAAATPVLAQDPAPAPAPAPEAVDSNLLYVGEWEWQASVRDTLFVGSWVISYANGRFTGVVTRYGVPPAPIRTFTVSNHFRNFDMTVDIQNEQYRFSGRLNNAMNIDGSLTKLGTFSRLRARKRG